MAANSRPAARSLWFAALRAVRLRSRRLLRQAPRRPANVGSRRDVIGHHAEEMKKEEAR
jgi:hypothetical protein